MSRNAKARQSRGGAAAGPVGEPCGRAGSPDHPTTAGADRRGSPDPETPETTAAADAPLTEAEILVGVTSWLAAARDWFDEEVALARGRLGLGRGDAAEAGACLALRLSDVERLLTGLGAAVRSLDGLSVDPARIRAFVDGAPPQGGNPGWVQ